MKNNAKKKIGKRKRIVFDMPQYMVDMLSHIFFHWVRENDSLEHINFEQVSMELYDACCMASAYGDEIVIRVRREDL